jgi:hypothetical protein
MGMKEPKDMSDDELFAELRAQVTFSRNRDPRYSRTMTRAVGAEMDKRGWNKPRKGLTNELPAT